MVFDLINGVILKYQEEALFFISDLLNFLSSLSSTELTKPPITKMHTIDLLQK